MYHIYIYIYISIYLYRVIFFLIYIFCYTINNSNKKLNTKPPYNNLKKINFYYNTNFNKK